MEEEKELWFKAIKAEKGDIELISALMEASALRRLLRRSAWSFSRKLHGQGVIQG
jgi:hypothetical protein